MFKKIALILAFALLTFTVVGCAQKETENNKGEALMYADYNGTKIELGASADKVLDELGEAQEVREIGDCGGLGAQVKYSYASLEIYVLESKTDGNIIDQITFRDDLVETAEGVFIGMKLADAKSKLADTLGIPTKESDKAIEYEKDGYVLRIGFVDSVITEIDYITA